MFSSVSFLLLYAVFFIYMLVDTPYSILDAKYYLHYRKLMSSVDDAVLYVPQPEM